MVEVEVECTDGRGRHRRDMGGGERSEEGNGNIDKDRKLKEWKKEATSYIG